MNKIICYSKDVVKNLRHGDLIVYYSNVDVVYRIFVGPEKLANKNKIKYKFFDFRIDLKKRQMIEYMQPFYCFDYDFPDSYADVWYSKLFQAKIK